ncbi:MAG TPA: WD40 repeat domain-containing serine/threonine protein kinase, partial [Planctomycetaceae bacterium]|nr:WD40 repeat domain-containing serine/threonine protein kinase [Planctomycetaceae bacterium]
MNPDVASRVDAICDAFERIWIAGQQPDLSAIMAETDSELRTLVAKQLMLVDAEYRRAKYGVVPGVDEYAVMLGVDPQDLMVVADTLDAAVYAQNSSPTSLESVMGNSTEGVSPGLDTDQFATTELRIGPHIPGYEILSVLGHGGMGVVYKARQIRADRIVALKTIHTPFLASQEQIQRFQAEAKATARLTHPNIVPVYEVDQGNGVHFFSMPWIDGPNLETLAREHVLSTRAAAEICRDLADALEYAHQNGVIHRDVKPLNILIGPDHKPRLTDFGVARFRDQDQRLTTTGQIIGTASYMAPEQATERGTDLGPTADVYSLGATLYRCITGRPPFQAGTTMEVLRQVANEEPVRPRRLNQEIDADIETLCLKCLEKKPANRFQTAAELSAELTRYLNREPIHSRPIGVMSRASRWCRRQPTIAASLILLTLLILLMSTGVPYVLWQKSELQEAALTKEHDARLMAQAESDRKLEQAGRQQAEQLAEAHAARAATQEYFVSIMKVRELRMAPDPKAGWTWEALDLLQKAATSNADGKDPVVLRSLIADTMMTPDLREIGRINNVPNTHALAVSHDGKLLAAGDYAGNPSQIRIYRVNTISNDQQRPRVEFELIRICSVDTTADLLQFLLNRIGVKSGTYNQGNGMWALDFSPDDKNIAVGTRNGNLTIWKIDGDPPQILFDKRFPESGAHRLQYSPDGRRIIVGYHDPASLRVFDIHDQSDRSTYSEEYVDFALTSSGKILVSREGHISRLSADSFSNSVEFAKEGSIHPVHIARNCSVALVGTVAPYLLDPITGETGLVLKQLPSEPNRPRDITFAADTTIAIAGVQPQNLKLWDAISGQRALDISYSGNEAPLICTGKEHDRVYAYSTVHTFAYQLRCAQPLQTDPGPPTPEPMSQLSNAAAPFSAFVPGAQILSCFALSNDQQHIAVVETAGVHDQQTVPENYRARLRKLNVSDGQETARWTCTLLSSGENSNTLTERESVTFIGDGRIAFTTAALGNIAVASQDGFQFPSGVGIDVTQQSPIVATANSASWMGMRVPEVSATNGFRPAIAMKLPRGLTQSKERLLLRLIAGETVHQYDLADQHLDSSGWHLVCLDHFVEALEPGAWRVEATLVESDLKLALNSDQSVANGESVIQLGHLYLLPSKQLKRGRTAPVFPLRLGPLVPRKDGGLAAVVE